MTARHAMPARPILRSTCFGEAEHYASSLSSSLPAMSSAFNPTPGELALTNQIFIHADPQKIGIITGEAAVPIFGGAKLPAVTLGEIWNIADEDNNGFLGKKGVSIAVRLMGWAQKGEKVTKALVARREGVPLVALLYALTYVVVAAGPLPVIEGITPQIQPQGTGAGLSKSPPPILSKSPPPGLPPLTAQDRAKYLKLFASSHPTNGLLSGMRMYSASLAVTCLHVIVQAMPRGTSL